MLHLLVWMQLSESLIAMHRRSNGSFWLREVLSSNSERKPNNSSVYAKIKETIRASRTDEPAAFTPLKTIENEWGEKLQSDLIYLPLCNSDSELPSSPDLFE